MTYLIVLLMAIDYGYSQDIMFQKTYGGKKWEGDCSLVQTKDSGFVILSNSTSFNNNPNPSVTIYNPYLIKTNKYGDTLWTRVFGGTRETLVEQLIKTTDDCFVFVGTIYEPNNQNIYIVKVDNEGNKKWERSWDKYGSSDRGYSIQQTQDGGYIVVGRSHDWPDNKEGMYILKTDTLGLMEWEKLYIPGVNYQGRTIVQTQDGGYMIAGPTDAGTFVMKTNYIGNMSWVKTYGCKIESHLIKTNDGCYAFTGTSGTGAYDIGLVKIQSNGDAWENSYNVSSGVDVGTCVKQTSDSGFIIGGILGGGQQNYYLLKTNPSGDTLWSKTFYLNSGECNDVVETLDGGYALAGNFRFASSPDSVDVLLIKTNQNGEVLGIQDEFTQMNFHLYENYPNPFNPSTTISYQLPIQSHVTLKVFDVLGREVATLVNRIEEAGYESVNFDASKLSSGIYFYRIQTGLFMQTNKMLLMK
jgi:hypothetical protein